MPAVLPFSIGQIEFRDTAGRPLELEQANAAWVAVADRGLDKLLGLTLENCDCADSERTILFGVFANDLFIGPWVLYRIRPIASDPNVVSCLVAPLLNLEDALLPEAGRFPDGSLHPIPQANIDRQQAFYRRTFGIMDWMLDNVMPQDDGTDLDIDVIRFPDASDGDPTSMEWHGGRAFFDDLARKEVDFRDGQRGDGSPVPSQMSKLNKLTDPDPDRPPLSDDPG